MPQHKGEQQRNTIPSTMPTWPGEELARGRFEWGRVGPSGSVAPVAPSHQLPPMTPVTTSHDGTRLGRPTVPGPAFTTHTTLFQDTPPSRRPQHLRSNHPKVLKNRGVSQRMTCEAQVHHGSFESSHSSRETGEVGVVTGIEMSPSNRSPMAGGLSRLKSRRSW